MCKKIPKFRAFLNYLMREVSNIDSSVCWIVFRGLPLNGTLLTSIYKTKKIEEIAVSIQIFQANFSIAYVLISAHNLEYSRK
jgi:hypothetical protein